MMPLWPGTGERDRTSTGCIIPALAKFSAATVPNRQLVQYQNPRQFIFPLKSLLPRISLLPDSPSWRQTSTSTAQSASKPSPAGITWKDTICAVCKTLCSYSGSKAKPRPDTGKKPYFCIFCNETFARWWAGELGPHRLALILTFPIQWQSPRPLSRLCQARRTPDPGKNSERQTATCLSISRHAGLGHLCIEPC